MRFVVVGDLHYWFYPSRGLNARRDEFYSRLFAKIAAVGPDVVFLIGDVSHTSRVEELDGLREIARQAGISHYYMVNGNHDLIRLSPQTVAAHNYNPQPGYFALHLDEKGQPVEAGSTEPAYHFCLLDTAQPGRLLDAAGWVGREQLKWLRQEIASAPAEQPLFVLGHHPLRGLTRWAWLPQMSIRNSETLWQVLAQRQEGPAFYLCGHNHANSVARRGNWLMIQNAAPLASLTFRLVETAPRQVKTRLVEIATGPERSELADLARVLTVAEANITNFINPLSPDQPADRKTLSITWSN